MNIQTINLTPPIDGVQYGYSDEPIKEGDWMWNQWKGTFEGCFGIAGKTWHKSMKKVICSTNPKDLRFPYLVLPSKEQEVKRLAKLEFPESDLIDTGSSINKFRMGFIAGFNANKGIYTQEQMLKCFRIGMLRERGTTNISAIEYLQSLSPIPKAVRVEMEVDLHSLKSSITSKSTISISAFSNIKVETSSEYPQGIVVVKEVIY